MAAAGAIVTYVKGVYYEWVRDLATHSRVRAQMNAALPPGLTLTGNTISGTPTGTPNYYSFTVRVTDSIGQRATKSVGIPVQNPLAISTATRASGCPRSTNTGDLPPSSSVTGTRLSLAARMTARPTAVLPVKKR